MGYHLTILRSADGQQIPIPLDEAKTATKTLGHWQFTDSPPTFIYNGPSGEVTARYDNGEIWTKFQGEEGEIDTLLTLAKKLNARLRGDELETYETSDKTYLHPDDKVLEKETRLKGRALIEKELKLQRRIRNFIIGFFVILGIIGFMIGKMLEN